jgi:hypothetical protein
MSGVHEAVLRVDVDRLHVGLPPARAKPLSQPVRGPPLGVRAGEPVLERAQLPNDLHAPHDVHARGLSTPGPVIRAIAG